MVLKRVFYRINQFVHAKSSKMSYSDIEFVRRYLTKPEQVLFYRMRTFDQSHGVMMAHKCLDKCKNYKWVDENILVRSALLHDVGKAFYNVSLLLRSIYVLLNKFNNGKFLSSIAKQNSKILVLRKLYILKNHPAVGAKMLSDIIDEPEIIEVVNGHHSKPLPSENK